MDLATSHEIAEWLKKRFPQQQTQPQLSPEIKQIGQKASSYWSAVKDKVAKLSSSIGDVAQQTSKKLLYDPETKRVLPDSVVYQLPEMAKQMLYNPDNKRILPNSPLYADNRGKMNSEELTMSLVSGIGTGVGMTKMVPKTGMKNIHVDDVREMSDFTDYTQKKWKPGDKYQYEGNVRDMAGKYGINPNQTNVKLAKDFSKILDQVSDKIGKAKGYVKVKVPASKDSLMADVKYLRDKMGRYAGSKSGKVPNQSKGLDQINQALKDLIKKKKKI